MLGLNPHAPEFVPSCQSSPNAQSGQVGSAWDHAEPFLFFGFESEDNITPEELEEIEATEAWVEGMAILDMMEREHMIELALRNTPKSRLAEIRARKGRKIRATKKYAVARNKVHAASAAPAAV